VVGGVSLFVLVDDWVEGSFEESMDKRTHISELYLTNE
jgi:hypothetical protein